MKARPTIFLSGVSHEFGVFRDAVENEIQKKGCFAENQSSFAPDYRTVEEMLRRRLTNADAVIHIVGFRFGAQPNLRPPDAPRRSYTQMEFDIARSLQKPVFIFISKDASVRQAPSPTEQPEDAELARLQIDHRDAVTRTNDLYYFFKDEVELRGLVAAIPIIAQTGEFRVDVSRIDKYAPAELIGREDELKVLHDVWLKVRRAESPRPHVLTFVALGGEGKTSLVAKWAADLAHHNWPGCDAAFRLRGLGRLTEALGPMRAGVKMGVEAEDWEEAAIRAASNLSELELTLGEVSGAVGGAEQTVTEADRSGDAFMRMTKHITHADALHQAGRRAEAETRFREAEQIQKEMQPDSPLLYSLRGFLYCDLLLAAPERAAWQMVLGSARVSRAGLGVLAETNFSEASGAGAAVLAGEPSREVRSGEDAGASTRDACAPQIESCRAVSQRAAQTIKWVESWQKDILSASLHHLTLGRAALYAAILENSDLRLLTSDLSHIDAAVAGLRRANRSDILPRGLLTRAWRRFLEGHFAGPGSAQEDLDEAWEIAERGPMQLHMADIHLYRARLFGMPNAECRMTKETRSTSYPWESPEKDLAEARRLIEKHGYGRRMGELEDAEAAIHST